MTDKGLESPKAIATFPTDTRLCELTSIPKAQTTVDGTSLTRGLGIETSKLRQAAAAVVVVRSREK
jgi:hypothetical protein